MFRNLGSWRREHPLSGLLGSNLFGLIDFNDRIEVARRALPQILALRTYQVEHDGKFPATLASLLIDQKYLDRLPTDPFKRGTPFAYVMVNGDTAFISFNPNPSHSKSVLLQATKGDRLLISVGPIERSSDDLIHHAKTNPRSAELIFPIRAADAKMAPKEPSGEK